MKTAAATVFSVESPLSNLPRQTRDSDTEGKHCEKGAHSTPPQEDFVMDLGGGRYDFYHSLNSGVLGSDDYLRAAPVDDILSSTMTPGTCVVSESEV